MKKSRDEEFPFAYLSVDDEPQRFLIEKRSVESSEKNNQRIMLHGQVQTLSLIALALFALLLALIFATIWAYDSRGSVINENQDHDQAGIDSTDPAIISYEIYEG